MEILISKSTPAGATYPDSGPGPTVLNRGDAQMGYFGTVTEAEFIGQVELSSAIGFTAGSAIPTASVVWIKCIMKEKILFIPTLPLRDLISWNDIYNAGAMYGDDTNGQYPVGGGVAQSAKIIKGGRTFRVRAFGQGDADPNSITADSYPPASTHEYGRFITKFYNGGNGQFAGSWKLFSLDPIVGRRVVQRVTPSVNVNNQLFFLFDTLNDAMKGRFMLKTWAGNQWWPVLELVQ